MVFPILLQENSPSLSLFNVSLLQYLYFQCRWMQSWPFISKQKTVTLFTQLFTYSLCSFFPFSYIWTSSLSQLLLSVCIVSILMWQLTLWSSVHIFRWDFLVLKYYNRPLIRLDTTSLQTSTFIPFPMQPFIFR